jgi:quercetin dioxygenase-like cupin family protein/transcriptional regulator with XRE-family HTH domain
LISQIETGKSSPSVSTLYALTTALGVSIEDVFAGPAGEAASAPEVDDAVAVPEPVAAGHLAGWAPAALAALALDGAGLPANPDLAAFRPRECRIGPVVTPGGREVLTLDSGVTWELLGQLPHTHVDFLLITYQPGGSSSSSGLLMRHNGTEFGYVISGELTLTLGFETHRLGAGDSVSFESSTPHGYRNETTEPAVGVWFVLESNG